ncbi:MAG TPA: GFA family protein [Acetobacteraceae bacterium]|nr:GFA family protein [Acetobacteraceae bacterium]
MTTGRCLCGSIRFEYSGKPSLVVHCHCDSCRRQTGSAMTTFVIVPKATLDFASGEPKEYASSPGVWRAFCGNCGSALYYRTDRRSDVVDLYAGTLEDPSALVPECHVHAAEQLPWFEVLDDLPRYPGSRWANGPVRHGPRH